MDYIKNKSRRMATCSMPMAPRPGRAAARSQRSFPKVKPKSSFKYPGKLKFDSKLILFSDELWAKELNWKNINTTNILMYSFMTANICDYILYSK